MMNKCLGKYKSHKWEYWEDEGGSYEIKTCKRDGCEAIFMKSPPVKGWFNPNRATFRGEVKDGVAENFEVIKIDASH